MFIPLEDQRVYKFGKARLIVDEGYHLHYGNHLHDGNDIVVRAFMAYNGWDIAVLVRLKEDEEFVPSEFICELKDSLRRKNGQPTSETRSIIQSGRPTPWED